MKWLIMFLLLIAKNSISTNDLLYNIKISNVDIFPHNIDKDFIIHIHHPEIKTHHIYSVIILEVRHQNFKETEQIFIYPGFIPKLDRRLKENYFHIMHFESTDFNTKIIVRFYRDSQGGEFSIHYSALGSENLHLQMPTDSMLIYKEIIYLYRPPFINLTIKSEDGHEGGLSINQRSIIKCTSVDGFPSKPINIKFKRELTATKQNDENEDMVEMDFTAQLKDHHNDVTCSSGEVSVTKQIKVFHHASSVEIIPENKSYMRQNHIIQCKFLGEGYPAPSVRWNINHLNSTTRKYFTITHKNTMSTIKINANAPNHTQWQFNCSALNYIPPLDYSGPYKLVNITIGENPEIAKLAAARIWTITIAVVILLIVFLIGLLCFGSRINCRSLMNKKKEIIQNNEIPPTSLICNNINIVNNEEKEPFNKDQEFEV